MSESKLFIIGNSGILHNANEFLSKYWLRYKQLETPLEVLIRPKKTKRSTLQNALLHAVLTDIAKQVKGCWMEHHLFTTKRGWFVDDVLIDWRQVEGWKYEQVFEDAKND